MSRRGWAKDPDEVGRFMRAGQKERDLAFLRKMARPGVVHLAAPGRLIKKPPR